MCGILGAVNRPFDEEILSLIKHRGPDSSGLVDVNVGGQRVTLGHRRLSIVDLSPAGHQPMQTPCGRFSLIFNGEIYNHQELRPGLHGVDFRGHSDTETMLHHIAQHGIEAVRDFNGIFSFAFVDSGAGKLFLVRDPFGTKPLYYCRQGEAFVFSSEIRPLRKMVEDSLDLDNLAELLRLRFSPSPDTLFRNIRKVRPGHILELDLRNPALPQREYPYLSQPPATIDIPFGEAVKRYGELFEQAVEKQLMSDVEVGILLSGGIDSALVAQYAQKHSTFKMKAFTVGYVEGHEADELEDARATASLLGMEHHEIRIDFSDFLGALQECVRIVEEPVATTSIIPMYSLSQMASSQVKVVLSGQGADEPLGGYGRYQGELIRDYLPAPLARIVGVMARLSGVRNDQVLRALGALPETDDIARFLRIYSVFDNPQICRLIGREDSKSPERLRYFYDLLGAGKRSHSVERMMALDLRMNLSDDLLLYTDKITMHHALECRVPILDHALVKFVESLPHSYRLKLGRTKIIHKAFARLSLPESVVRRKKKGFLSPTKTWFRKAGPLRDILLDPAARFASTFDLSEVGRVLTEHENGFNRERHIFLLLCLHSWMGEFA